MGLISTFRYSAPLIVPDRSEIKDQRANQEIQYLLNAIRTLAVHLDKLTGGLSPLRTDWDQYVPDGFFAATDAHKIYALCEVNIAYGAMVNLHDPGTGVLNARYAQASGAALVSSGFCNTPGGFSAGDIGEFICGPGICTGIAGLAIGTWYYLDPVTLTGQITATQPAVPGQAVQIIGQAIAADKLLVGAFNNWRIL